VSGMKHTHPNKEWTGPLGGFFDSSTGLGAPTTVSFVLVLGC
jgi:hypothetical protein